MKMKVLKNLFHNTAKEVEASWNCAGLADAGMSSVTNDPEEGFYERFAWEVFLKMLDHLGVKHDHKNNLHMEE